MWSGWHRDEWGEWVWEEPGWYASEDWWPERSSRKRRRRDSSSSSRSVKTKTEGGGLKKGLTQVGSTDSAVSGRRRNRKSSSRRSRVSSSSPSPASPGGRKLAQLGWSPEFIKSGLAEAEELERNLENPRQPETSCPNPSVLKVRQLVRERQQSLRKQESAEAANSRAEGEKFLEELLGNASGSDMEIEFSEEKSSPKLVGFSPLRQVRRSTEKVDFKEEDSAELHALGEALRSAQASLRKKEGALEKLQHAVKGLMEGNKSRGSSGVVRKLMIKISELEEEVEKAREKEEEEKICLDEVCACLEIKNVEDILKVQDENGSKPSSSSIKKMVSEEHNDNNDIESPQKKFFRCSSKEKKLILSTSLEPPPPFRLRTKIAGSSLEKQVLKSNPSPTSPPPPTKKEKKKSTGVEEEVTKIKTPNSPPIDDSKRDSKGLGKKVICTEEDEDAAFFASAMAEYLDSPSAGKDEGSTSKSGGVDEKLIKDALERAVVENPNESQELIMNRVTEEVFERTNSVTQQKRFSNNKNLSPAGKKASRVAIEPPPPVEDEKEKEKPHSSGSLQKLESTSSSVVGGLKKGKEKKKFRSKLEGLLDKTLEGSGLESAKASLKEQLLKAALSKTKNKKAADLGAKKGGLVTKGSSKEKIKYT